MNPSELISEIRDHINKAQLDRAFDSFLPWLDQKSASTTSWADTVRGLLSRYKKLISEERKNIITKEQADLTRSQITNSLLGVLTAIENGDEPSQPTSTSKIPWMTIGIVVALVLATASFFMIGNTNGSIDTPPDTDTVDDIDIPIASEKCPPFEEESVFNIMILPYQPLGGEQKNIDKGLKIRLSSMMEEYDIKGSVKAKDFDVNSPNYPASSNEAVPIGKPCKAQLIIWGYTEEIGDKTATITNFRFLDKDHFALTGLDLNQVDTISSISSIATSQELTENIEQSIKLILGLVAYETKNYVASSELLEETIEERGGAGEVPNWGLLLAESKLKSGENMGALAVYDQILEKNNQHSEALVQKGIVAFNAGNYDLAVESLNPVLDKDPNNTDARMARAAAYMRSNDLYQASVDIESMEQKNITVKGGAEVMQEYKTRYKAEETKKKEAEERLENNPSDTSALRIQAQTARNLGQFDVASLAASNLLATDPSNMAALTTLMEIKPMVSDSNAVQLIINRVQQPLNAVQMRKLNLRTIKGGG